MKDGVLGMRKNVSGRRNSKSKGLERKGNEYCLCGIESNSAWWEPGTRGQDEKVRSRNEQ